MLKGGVCRGCSEIGGQQEECRGEIDYRIWKWWFQIGNVVVWKGIERNLILRAGRDLRGKDKECPKERFCQGKVGEIMGTGAE